MPRPKREARKRQLTELFIKKVKSESHAFLVWDTKQSGAVGRMKTKGLDKLYFRIEGELLVKPFGEELITLLKEAYLGSPDIAPIDCRRGHKGHDPVQHASGIRTGIREHLL